MMAMPFSKEFIKFQKPVSRRPSSKWYGAIDIETNKTDLQIPGTTALGGECSILTYAYETRKGKRTKANDSRAKREVKQGYVKDWRAFFELLDDMPELQKIDWFIHNLEFDFARAYQCIVDKLETGHVMKPIINGMGKYICVKIHDQDNKVIFKCRDSACVIAGTLEEVTANLSPDCKKLTGAIDFEGGEQFDINNNKHVEYALQDTLSLLKSMINLETLLIKHFGVPLKLTAASISMTSFRVGLFHKSKQSDNEIFKRETKDVRCWQRQAYYGGYVYCGLLTGNNLYGKFYHYDFSSCYPYCMRKFGVPSGGKRTVTSYKLGDIGIYRVKVEVKDDHIPIAPLRTKNGIVWPRGSFETTVSSPDLESFMLHNIKFEIIEGIRFKKYTFPFEQIVNTCEQLRIDFKGTAVEMMAKLIQNSLYGKFASKEELTETIFKKESDDEYSDFMVGDYETTVLDKYRQVKMKELDEDYLIISWSVFITAQARKHLHTCMLIAGKENVHYTDTDSLILTERGRDNLLKSDYIELHELKENAKYGDLVQENVYIEVLILAPKVYVTKTIQGKYKGKIKGIPKKLRNEQVFNSILSGDEQGAFEFESVCGLNAIFKGGNYSTVRKRKMTDFSNCKGWAKDNDEKVRSVLIKDIKNIIPYEKIA